MPASGAPLAALVKSVESFARGCGGDFPYESQPTEPMITFGEKVYPAPVLPTLSFINDWQPFAV